VLTQAVADSWFLATKNHRSTVHSYSHSISTSSAPHPWGRAPPNCRPLTTPLITATAPYPPSSFDLIISRSLPSILRSTEYPPFLRDCIRMLKSGGHLVISFVDPSPKNFGPLMARWTEGLKLKLEMQFHCTRPSELLPYWLNEVGALAGPVEVETMDWVAVEESDGGDQWDTLRSVTGRAVYRKLYESFIQPDGGETSGVWWWEDPLIVEECRALGTTFQLYKYLHLKE
jgi:SAM-dependent methyltransferase